MATNRDRHHAKDWSDSDSDSDPDDYRSRLRKFSPFDSRLRHQEASSSSSSMAVETFDSDLDFAFNLQLQEALAASLALQSLSSSAADTSRARPLGEGSSRTAGESSSSSASASASTSSQSADSAEVFRLYFKGLAVAEKAGIGVAICDPRGKLIFDTRKVLLCDGANRVAADTMALIEGLNAALALDLKRVVLCCDSPTTHQFISRRWTPKQRKVTLLIDQATSLQKKFVLCNSRLLARNEINLAIKFAREAMESPVKNHPAEPSGLENSPTETCAICSEDKNANQIFSVKACNHRYCVSCMRQHVEYKLRNALAPNCPHESCKSKLDISSCKEFLAPEFLDIMRQRQREATIPVGERVYCPYPKCSVLMSRAEVLEYSRKYRVNVDRLFARKCVKCKGFFCLNCKVPWHSAMSCEEYKRANPNRNVDDTKLKLLASVNLWSQCKKCNLIIELAGGCYHMKCRCGYEFCYNCEAEWKDKKATCSCPLWDERNIVRDEDRDDDDDDDDDDDEYDEEEEDEGYDYESEEEPIYYNEDLGIYFRM